MFSDMHPSTMLATMAIFLAMIVILNAMLYKPLLKFMDERNESIKNDEMRVKKNSKEMVDVDEELEAIHAKTRDEIIAIKQAALNQAKLVAAQVLKAKKDDIERRMSDFYNDLETQRNMLKQELSSKMPEFSASLNNTINKS